MAKTNKNNSTKTGKSAKKVEVDSAKDATSAKTLLTNNGIKVSEDGTIEVDQTIQDFRSAVLVISLAINFVVFITWIILQLTTQYDAALLQAFLRR